MLTAATCASPSVGPALALAKARLQLDGRSFDVRVSERVACPVIWCWGRRPKLLLPPEAVEALVGGRLESGAVPRAGASQTARSLGGALLPNWFALVPWQPLAWWAKRRLEQASEQACDDWTIASGHEAADYAEALLNLVAQADPAPALARGAAARGWSCASSICWRQSRLSPASDAVGAWPCSLPPARSSSPWRFASAASCEPPPKRPRPAKPPRRPKPSSRLIRAAAGPPTELHANGKILDTDGKPIAGATIVWQAYLGPGWYDPYTGTTREPIELTRTASGPDGEFNMTADVAGKTITGSYLVILAKGYGLRGCNVDGNNLAKPLEVHMERSYPIEATIYSPNGEPVKDAEIVVDNVQRCFASTRGESAPIGRLLLVRASRQHRASPQSLAGGRAHRRRGALPPG